MWIRGNEVDATLEITPDTILICELVPNDIPIVAALVTSQLQTPLCHVALLSQNRKSPNIAVRDIIMVREPHARDRLFFRLADTRRDSNEKDDAVLALDGKPARLTANLQTWSLEAVSESELEAWTAERKRSVTVVQQPMVSTSVKRLIDITAEAKALADSRGELAANVGAKAQQIALVESSAVRKDRPRVKILEAFAVPFHYFCEHFARSGGDKLLAAIETERAETVQVDPLTSSAALRDSLTASAMFRAANSSYDEGTQSRNVRESGFDSILRMSGQVAPEIAAIELAPLLTEQLQRVRDAIIAAPINDELVAAIRAQIAAWRRTGVLGERQGVIFRSSTNVEDLPGTRWHTNSCRVTLELTGGAAQVSTERACICRSPCRRATWMTHTRSRAPSSECGHRCSMLQATRSEHSLASSSRRSPWRCWCSRTLIFLVVVVVVVPLQSLTSCAVRTGSSTASWCTATAWR